MFLFHKNMNKYTLNQIFSVFLHKYSYIYAEKLFFRVKIG